MLSFLLFFLLFKRSHYHHHQIFILICFLACPLYDAKSSEPFITVKQKLSEAHVVGKCDLLEEITVMTEALWLPQASEMLIAGEKCKPDVLGW